MLSESTVRLLSAWPARRHSHTTERNLVDATTGIKKPLYDRVSVYLNVDNGGGKIRGIYLQGNQAAAPMFEAWLKPFKEFGAATVSIRDSEGSDHEVLDRAGIPGFAVIQDPLNYMTRTHHSTMDYLDYVSPNDLKSSALVLAALLYEAANDPAMCRERPWPHDHSMAWQ